MQVHIRLVHTYKYSIIIAADSLSKLAVFNAEHLTTEDREDEGDKLSGDSPGSSEFGSDGEGALGNGGEL